jgi:transcriptional regulator with XRE-family HTH domain
MKTIGKRISSIRKNAHMTQAEFALEVGVATGYLSQIETGVGNPGGALVKLIAARFRVCEEWLTTGNGPQYMTELDASMDKVEAAPESTLPPSKRRSFFAKQMRHMIDLLNGGNLSKFSKNAKISRTTVDSWVKEIAEPKRDNLQKLLDYTKQTEEFFFPKTQEESSSTAVEKVVRSSNIVEMEHINIIPGFKDKPTARNIATLLLEMERIDPEALPFVESYLEGQVQLLRRQAKKNSLQRRGKKVRER